MARTLPPCRRCLDRLIAAQRRRGGRTMVAYKRELAEDTQTFLSSLVVLYGETLSAIARGQGGTELSSALARRSVPRLERLVDGLKELELLVVDIEGFPVIDRGGGADALTEAQRILERDEQNEEEN